MTNEKLAKEIVDYLFENVSHQQAERLVLELPDGRNGGGWSKKAAYSAVLSIISAQRG